MTLDSELQHLDRLFARTERGAFRPSGTGYGGDTSTVSGESSEQVMQGILAAQGATSGTDFENGGFWVGPDDPDSPIDDEENSLEGWDIVHEQGTACDVTWVANALSPSGYDLTFTMTDGSTDDETYFEQEFPVLNAYQWLIASIRHYTDNVNLKTKVAVQFLDEAGDTVGSEITGTWSSLTAVTSRLFTTPPSALAVTARVRFGVVATAGFSGAQVANILFITGRPPQMLSVNISGVFSEASPAASTDYMMPYPSDMIPGGVYRADSQGFVLGVSGKSSDTISAGTITVQVENDTAATTPGPTVALSSGTAAGESVQSLSGSYAYDFDAGDEIHLELSADGSFSSTGGADYFASARLLLVVGEAGVW